MRKILQEINKQKNWIRRG